MAIPGTPGSQLPRGEDHIPREIADLKRSQREGFASVAESFGPVVKRLEDQDTIILAQTAALAAQDVVILAQQAALAAANVTLSAAVANIQTLVGQQTTGSAGSASTGTGVNLTGAFQSYAVITFNVPAGYTVAAVTANSAAGLSGNDIRMATRIGGADGQTMDVYGMSFGNGASNHARVFSVTPGGTFTVETRAFVGGSAVALLTTSASVTFYR